MGKYDQEDMFERIEKIIVFASHSIDRITDQMESTETVVTATATYLQKMVDYIFRRVNPQNEVNAPQSRQVRDPTTGRVYVIRSAEPSVDERLEGFTAIRSSLEQGFDSLKLAGNELASEESIERAKQARIKSEAEIYDSLAGVTDDILLQNIPKVPPLKIPKILHLYRGLPNMNDVDLATKLRELYLLRYTPGTTLRY